MKTIEDNKLIAEFMGFEINSGFNYKLVKVKNFLAVGEDGRYSKEEDLKFNSSWDWLMPVVEKIIKIIESNKFIFHSFRIGTTSINAKVEVDRKFTHFNFYYIEDGSMLKSYYLFCVEFIKWYNKNK